MTGDRCGQPVAGMLIGDARCSTDEQDLNLRRDALAALGVTPKRIDVDHGVTGINGSGQGGVNRSPPVEPATTPSRSHRGLDRYRTPETSSTNDQPRTETQHRLGARPDHPVGRTSTPPSSCWRCSASNPPTNRVGGTVGTIARGPAPAARSSTPTPTTGADGAFLPLPAPAPCKPWLPPDGARESSNPRRLVLRGGVVQDPSCRIGACDTDVSASRWCGSPQRSAIGTGKVRCDGR